MRRSIRLFLLLPIILAWVAVNPTAAVEKRSVVVGIYQTPPLIFSEPDGRMKGIAADLLEHIAGKERWSLQFRYGTWAQCTQWLEAGTIDLLPGMATSPERQDRFAFNREPIADNWGQLYVRPDAAFSDILAFDGKSIAVVDGDIYFQYLETILGKFDIRPDFILVGDYGTVFSMLHQKKVSAGVVSRLYGTYYEKQYRVKRSPISFRPTELHFAVANGRHADLLTALDGHLRQLKANPNSIFYQSLDQWTQGVRKVSFPLWLRPLWLLVIVLGVIGLILAGNIFLRRQVRIQTEALKKTIAEKEKIESDLAIAREIQLQLVPGKTQAFPNRKEFDIYAALEPAREVGGDFYDFFFIDRNALCLVVGDVSGKGVPAALFMAMTKTMIKSAARLLVEPEFILADVNREIARNNPSMTFVTVFLGVLDLNTGMLTYASAGHNPPLVIGKKGSSVLLGEAQCPAIGLDDSFQYHQATVQLHHGEGLLLFSDGVIEAENRQAHPFTQEALMNAVAMTAGLTPKERIEALLSRIREFSDSRPLEDDMALLALTYFSPHRLDDTFQTIYLKNELHEMDRIVDAIARVAEAVACPPVVAHDITLAIEEIFSNIVFYGFGDDLDHTIVFTIAIEADTLVLTLQDEGIPFNPLNVQPTHRERALEEHEKGGMGIILAKNLMDRLTYRRERGKNILRMEKRYH